MKIRLIAPMLGLLGLGLASPALAQCPAFDAVHDQMRAGNAPAAMAQIEQADDDLGCTAGQRDMVRRVAALTRFNQIATQVGAGADLGSFGPELERLRKEGGPWQVYDALADIARANKDYKKAAEFYLIALEDASDTVRTPEWMAPDEAYIRHLDQAATEMRLASGEAPRLSLRGGCRISYRAVTIAKKTTPVRFEFGTAKFTLEGEESADEMLTCLKSTGAKNITLIGHTDPVGSDYNNQILSEKRAAAMRDYLYEHGYEGEIEVVGKGETEPFHVDDPKAYDQDTLFQMYRRVDVEIH